MFHPLVPIIAAALLTTPAAATVNLSGAVPTVQPMVLASAALVTRIVKTATFDNSVAAGEQLTTIDLMSENDIRALSLRSVRPASPSWQKVLTSFFNLDD